MDLPSRPPPGCADTRMCCSAAVLLCGLSVVAIAARGGPQAGGVSFISSSTCVFLALFLSAAPACGRSDGQKNMTHDVLSGCMQIKNNFLFYSLHRRHSRWSERERTFCQTFRRGGVGLFSLGSCCKDGDTLQQPGVT